METSIVPTPKLPDDLIIQILARLPVKTLVRFSCVSKSWLSLISSKHFIKTHLNHSKNCADLATHRIILRCRDDLKQCLVPPLLSEPITDAFDTDYPVNLPRKPFGVVGSCDGLLCLRADRKNLILWNPSTRICKILPDFDFEMDPFVYFAYGFGFDESSDDYKVVAGLFSRGIPEVMFHVFSLKNDEWKRIKNFEGPRLMSDPATFVNGKLYWMADHHDDDQELESIASLDLRTEEFEVIQMPSYVKSGIYSRLCASDGFLYVLCSHLMCAELWIMSGCEGSWSKVVMIPYVDDFLKYSYKMLLHVLRNGEILLLCSSTIVIFDSRDGSFRYPQINNLGRISALGTYLDSLVSPVG